MIGRKKIFKIDAPLRMPLNMMALSDSNDQYYEYMVKNGIETNRNDKTSGFYVQWELSMNDKNRKPVDSWEIH